MVWALVHDSDRAALLPLSECSIAQGTCVTQSMKLKTGSVAGIFKDLCNGDANLHSWKTLHSIKNKHELTLDGPQPDVEDADSKPNPNPNPNPNPATEEKRSLRSLRSMAKAKGSDTGKGSDKGGEEGSGDGSDGQEGGGKGDGGSEGRGGKASSGKKGKGRGGKGSGGRGRGAKDSMPPDKPKASRSHAKPAESKPQGGPNRWTDFIRTKFKAVKAEMEEEGLPTSMVEVNKRLRKLYHSTNSGVDPVPDATLEATETDREAELAARKKRKREAAQAAYHEEEAKRKRETERSERKRLKKEAKEKARHETKLAKKAKKLKAARAAQEHGTEEVLTLPRAAPAHPSPASPSPPPSVQALKRSIRGLEGAQRLDRQAVREQHIEELKYDLEERLRKKKKYGSW
jgi:hypothetical protein